jgi:AcrR family transcriptional regulator
VLLEPEVRFRIRAYGVDVPFVNPYICYGMSQILEPTVRPQRADARRNREKVLAAARAAFAEQGAEAQMDDVARRAEVGVGTVYRHFPTKEALLLALSRDMFARIAERSRRLLELEDPWEAFTTMMWDAAESLAGDRALTEAMSVRIAPEQCPGQLEMGAIAAEIMQRAQAAGRMRPDVVVDDIPMLMCGVGSASGRPHPFQDSWRRHLSILLDGLRADAASGTLPH